MPDAEWAGVEGTSPEGIIAVRDVPHWLFPPMAAVVHHDGMRMVLWDVSVGDWKLLDPEAVARRVLAEVRPGSVIRGPGENNVVDNAGNCYILGQYTGTNLDFNMHPGTDLKNSNNGGPATVR